MCTCLWISTWMPSWWKHLTLGLLKSVVYNRIQRTRLTTAIDSPTCLSWFHRAFPCKCAVTRNQTGQSLVTKCWWRARAMTIMIRSSLTRSPNNAQSMFRHHCPKYSSEVAFVGDAECCQCEADVCAIPNANAHVHVAAQTWQRMLQTHITS